VESVVADATSVFAAVQTNSLTSGRYRGIGGFNDTADRSGQDEIGDADIYRCAGGRGDIRQGDG